MAASSAIPVSICLDSPHEPLSSKLPVHQLAQLFEDLVSLARYDQERGRPWSGRLGDASFVNVPDTSLTGLVPDQLPRLEPVPSGLGGTAETCSGFRDADRLYGRWHDSILPLWPILGQEPERLVNVRLFWPKFGKQC